MATTTPTTNPTQTFWTLPRELQLLILEHLPFADYINFSLSCYHPLRISFPDYFPAITRSRLRAMRSPPPTGFDPLQQLPNEMILHIARYTERRYLLRWVFAHWWTLGRCNPPLVSLWGTGTPVGATGGDADGRQLFMTWFRLDGSR
jgi:hypothetical protein